MEEKLNTNGIYNEQITVKDLPLEGQNYVLVEYSDYYYNGNSNKTKVKDLGSKFAAINSFFLDYVKGYHIPTAFIKNEEPNSLRFMKNDRLLFSIKILNILDKRTAKIFGQKEGEQLNLPVFEYHFGNQKDTLVSESALIAFDLCTNEDLKLINRICSKVNAVLKSFFERRNEILAEVNCNFGKAEDKIYLVDDFTPRGLKIIPAVEDDKWVDPYKMSSSSEVRKYTDYLFSLTNA